ncbi:MAG: hypothetical protein Ct9H300mP28_25250 [Pseudomonadota bacterium]|nr:MAG: hypothetical protein Ct9H300mP28_25250 [Pseudomonadota bacterium]
MIAIFYQQHGTDLFTKYFGDFFGTNELHVLKLIGKWVLVGWDSAHPNDLGNCCRYG